MKFAHKGETFTLGATYQRHGDANGGVVMLFYDLRYKRQYVDLPAQAEDRDPYHEMLADGTDVEYQGRGLDRGAPKKFSKQFLKYLRQACEAHLAD